MKKKIHVNQHKIRSNSKTGDREPVITVKTYKSNTYCSEVYVDGPCKIVYSPDKPLPCGAKVWIETESEVICEKTKKDVDNAEEMNYSLQATKKSCEKNEGERSDKV